MIGWSGVLNPTHWSVDFLVALRHFFAFSNIAASWLKVEDVLKYNVSLFFGSPISSPHFAPLRSKDPSSMQVIYETYMDSALFNRSRNSFYDQKPAALQQDVQL